MAEETPCAARFSLLLRCHNCQRNVSRRLDVPCGDEAPRDIDELLGSAFLQKQRYKCESCEGGIGTLIAIKQIELDLAPL